MRKIPENIAKLGKSLKIEPKENDERITQTRQYKLITPLFGGGVSPRENDPSKLIRETSIRGQLRFWWRAMRGNGTLAEMKKREDAIFGSANQDFGQSKISIAVAVNKIGTSEQIYESGGGNPKPVGKWQKIAYAAFALQPTKDEPNQKEIRVGVEFALNISYPRKIEIKNNKGEIIVIVEDTDSEIEAAIWAWETFGGIGGRTRRGFGALDLFSAAKNAKELQIAKYKTETAEKDIKNDLVKHLLPNKICDKNVPHLTIESNFKVKKSADSQTAWNNVIDKFRQFRQFRRDKNTQQVSPFGKSQWSEPRAIKAIDRNFNNEGIVKFPRGEFGLPIIFHFPQREIGLPDYTLNLKNEERLASSLILKPISCADGAVSAALLIESSRASEFSLEVKSQNKQKEASAKLTTQEAKQLTDNGLTPLENKTDVLQAFLDFFVKDSADNQNKNNQKNNWRR